MSTASKPTVMNEEVLHENTCTTEDEFGDEDNDVYRSPERVSPFGFNGYSTE